MINYVPFGRKKTRELTLNLMYCDLNSPARKEKEKHLSLVLGESLSSHILDHF